MARVIGESGRNAAEESHKRTRRFLLVALIGIALLSIVWGFMLGTAFPIQRFGWQIALVIAALFWVSIFLIVRWISMKMDALDRERMSWRKGALGEWLTAETLRSLPDGYVVINDVTKKLGNIDHVGVGPTGVYVVNTKNWKGTVKADGKGELLVNGRSPDKPAIKNMLGGVMDFQNKLKALTEADYFVRGLLVFPIAYVEADFGSTRHVHCMRDERLVDYIQNKTFTQSLSSDDVDRVTRATLQLAGMDKRFASV
jgi:Nuclease-related domain